MAGTAVSAEEQLANTFEFALSKGYVAALEVLLAGGVPFPANAHLIASRSDDAAAALSLLRERGVLLEQHLNECLKLVVARGKDQAAALLLRWGADANSSALLDPAAFRYPFSDCLIPLLLEAKADPQAHDRQGEKALLSLLSKPRSDQHIDPKELGRSCEVVCDHVGLLLQHGVNANAMGPFTNALERAMEVNEYAPAVSALLRAGADPSRSSGGGPSLIATALNKNAFRCIEAFLAHDGGACLRGSVGAYRLTESLLRRALQSPSCDGAAALLRYCDPQVITYDRLGDVLLHTTWNWPDSKRAYVVQHAVLLYLYQYFPGRSPYDPLRVWRAPQRYYRHYPHDWYRRCPEGLDEAARRLLTEAGADVQRIDAWISDFREIMRTQLGPHLPLPVWNLVSMY